MYNNYFNELVLKMDFEKLSLILEETKNLKSDIVIIPRILNQSDLQNSILGVSANSIMVFGLFEKLKNLEMVPLWDDESLSHISFSSKEVNPFLKILNDYSKANNIKIQNAYIKYRQYEINNEIKSLANRLEVYDTNGNILSNVLGNNTVVSSFINLIEYDTNLFNILRYRELWFNGIKIPSINITNDPKFIDIINSKATDGAQIWIPDENLYGSVFKPYIMYLNKAFLNISKGDNTNLTITDFIPGLPINYFLASFEVLKPKKKCKLYISFMAIKLNK